MNRRYQRHPPQADWCAKDRGHLARDAREGHEGRPAVLQPHAGGGAAFPGHRPCMGGRSNAARGTPKADRPTSRLEGAGETPGERARDWKPRLDGLGYPGGLPVGLARVQRLSLLGCPEQVEEEGLAPCGAQRQGPPTRRARLRSVPRGWRRRQPCRLPAIRATADDHPHRRPPRMRSRVPPRFPWRGEPPLIGRATGSEDAAPRDARRSGSGQAPRARRRWKSSDSIPSRESCPNQYARHGIRSKKARPHRWPKPYAEASMVFPGPARGTRRSKLACSAFRRPSRIPHSAISVQVSASADIGPLVFVRSAQRRRDT